MKVIIAGGRNYSNYEEAKEYFDRLLMNQTDIEIVSGRCDCGVQTFTTDDGEVVCGVDGLGERYAKEKGHPVKPFPADWKTYGKKAGYYRNRDMSHYAQGLIALWDGYSRGTRMMIKLAKENCLQVRVKIIR